MATHYPKKGKGNQWSVRELECITAEWQGDAINDGGGLQGEVRVSRDDKVTIRFRYRFRLKDKVYWHQCGTFPTSKISDIRAERDRARVLVAGGINPAEAKQAERIEAQACIAATLAQAEQERTQSQTVADMFSAWIADGVARKDGNAELVRRFEKDVLPTIGRIKVKALCDADLLAMLRDMKARGVKDDAQRNMNRSIEALYSDVSQMLRWAEKRKPWRLLLAENGNPAELIEVQKLLDNDYQSERDRVLSEDEIRELWKRFEQLESDYEALEPGRKYSGTRPPSVQAQCAVWICLSTLCRIGELLMSRWEHVDFESGTWFIPAANTKAHKGKKQSHHIILSPFTIEQFKRLKAVTGHTDYCFPARDSSNHVCLKSISKMIGDRQVMFKNRSKPLSGRIHDNSLVLDDGKNGEWTPHDLRRTGATMMQELKVPLDVIDRCQNHVIAGSKVRRHYMKYDYAEEKAHAWKVLGEKIESILEGYGTDFSSAEANTNVSSS